MENKRRRSYARGELGHRYEQADKKAKARRYQSSDRRVKMRGKTVFIIKEKLKVQWSPEQISGWLKRMLLAAMLTVNFFR